MSVGPLGMLGSLASTQSATRTADVDKAQHEQANHARETTADIKTEMANGIGSTDEFSESTDRDADGRQLMGRSGSSEQPESTDASEESAASEPACKDPHGESGNQLDLQG